MFQLSWKTGQTLPKSEPMDCMVQRLLWYPTFSLDCPSYVCHLRPLLYFDSNQGLVLISLLFSIVSYWLSNFQPTAEAFFTWVMWIFLDLVAAESLVVLVTAIFPNFVIALALVAFANGLWMSVGGFLVTPTILNPFWKYVFHYIDYQVGQRTIRALFLVRLTFQFSGICFPGHDGQ